MKSRWFAWFVGFVGAGIIVGVGAWYVGLWANGRGLNAAAEVTPASIRPSLEIDTNAVMVDVLANVSGTVQRLKVPLATPLTPDKVLSFRTRPVLTGRPSSLRSEMIYEGGYEFRHQDSIVFEYRAPDSVRKSAVARIPSVRPGYDHDTFWTNVLLARLTFKAALRRLGHTNLTLLDQDPSVLDRWADWMDSDPPHWFLTWSDQKGGGAVAEIDAETLTLKHYALSIADFGREPWPTTLTHSRRLGKEDSRESPAPDWSELKLDELNRDYVIALIRTVLPEAREFCAQIGPPFPTRFTETDLELKESMIGIWNGRVWMRLRLKSGFTMSYHQGRVVGIRAPDSAMDSAIDGNSPEQDGLFRQSKEYVGPTRLGAEQAVARIRDVAVNKLGLPWKALGLDTDPVFRRSVDATSTNGLRRYVIYWQHPETESERKEREYYRLPRGGSVWGEVDAVSGELKSFTAGGKALIMPDPVIPGSCGLSEKPGE